MPGIRERALALRPLVTAVQMAVTGERRPRRHRLLAESLLSGEHGFLIDLGCGSAALLDHVRPARYVGIDEHEPSLDVARRQRAAVGREFVCAPIATVDLAPYFGADVVVLSSVCHHLSNVEVAELLERLAAEVAPARVLVQDAEPTGLLGPLVRRLDDGDHMRSCHELAALSRPRWTVDLLWTYDNPWRSFHQYLLELRLKR